MTANTDIPDTVGEHRHPYGPCHHTKYEGCPPCVHSAWDEGVQAAREAASNERSKFKARDWDDAIDAAAAIDALAVDR